MEYLADQLNLYLDTRLGEQRHQFIFGAEFTDSQVLIGVYTGLTAAQVERLDRRQARHRDDGRRFERNPGRLVGELGLLGDGELGERSRADAEHLVSHPEPRHAGADGHDPSGEVEARHRVAGTPEPERQAGRSGQTDHEVPGAPVEPGGVDGDQDLAVARDRDGELAEVPRVGRGVGALDDRSHRSGGFGHGVLRDSFACRT